MFGKPPTPPDMQALALKILEDELVRLHRLADMTHSRDQAMPEITRINAAIASIATGTVESRMKAIEDALTDLDLTTERANDGKTNP